MTKAARAAKLVASRVGRAPGGSLSDAINSFSQQRNAQLTRPAANGDLSAQLAMYQRPPELMVADAPQRKQQSTAQGVGDLGDEIDKGAKWLSGTPDEDTIAPAKGTPQKVGPLVSSPTNGDPISSVVAGLRHLETGGLKDPYHYVSPTGAMGAYGVEPATLAGWTKGTKYEGISAQDYLNNPSIQDDVARIGATGYYNQYNGDVSKVGQAWLGGPGSVGKSVRDPVTGITTDQYGANLANIVNSQRPQPQAQAAPPPPAQPQASTNGPQAQADPMSNLYNKVAFSPNVAAGYDNPQAMFDPDTPQAKRGGRMRKHFDDGGDAGGGDGGDSGDSAGNSAATAAGVAAGFGGVGDAAGAPAGTSTNSGVTGFGGVGDDGFGGASPGGVASVGVNAPGVTANQGFGGQGVAANSAPSGAGGVGTAGVGGGSSGGGPGGTGGGAGTAAGGSGVSSAQEMFASQHPYGVMPAYYDAGFGLGKGGAGNVAAGQSNTATQNALAQTQMRYGFVNGNDPGLANSATGQAALAQSPAAQQSVQEMFASQHPYGNVGFGGGSPSGSSAPGHGVQGFGNAGFGGGSPSATVGGFGGNANSTGAEGVSTSSLAPPGTPMAAMQNAQIQADMQQYDSAKGIASAPAPATQVQAQQQVAAPPPAAIHAVAPPAHAVGRAVARGGYIRRADGGAASVAHIPTNELIQYALDRIRQRKNFANGGDTDNGNFTRNLTAIPGGGFVSSWSMGSGSAASGGGEDIPAQQAQPQAAPAAAPAPANNPAIPSGVVGNQGGIGSPGFNPNAPIGGVPTAIPNGRASNSTNPNGPQYNNTLDQALQTNDPTMSQIFGFNYPVPPPPKAQPVGPVPQSLINGEFGFGGGSQVGTGAFQGGGAVIMDAALNTARRAIKGRTKGQPR